MFENIVYIYKLIDPITNQTRYIGKTVNPLKRLIQHKHEAKKGTNRHVCNWIRSLLEKKELPKIEYIKVTSINNWEYFEKYYIKLYKELGYNLTNSSEGGENSSNSGIKYKSQEHYRTDKIIGTHIKTNKEIFLTKLTDAEDLGFNISRISQCCKSKNGSIHKNYVWRYEGEELQIPKYIPKVVIAQHYETKKILRFNYVNEAEKMGFGAKEIFNCLKGKAKHHKGYFWKYEDSKEDFKDIKISIDNRGISVIRITPKTGEIKLYESCVKTKEDGFKPSNVSRCCLGQRKTYKNFYWKYKE